jgi:exodeoxyribonuclease-3
MILRLLSYNIRYGGNGREGPLAETIRSAAPDLVVLQEATDPGVVSRVAAATGMKHWGATRGYSVGFMSRVEVARHEWHRPPPIRRSILEIELAGSKTRVFGVHLSAIHSNWTEGRRLRELDAVLDSVAHHQHGLHVLAGDFNTLAPGSTLDIRRLPKRLQLLALIGGQRIRWRTIQALLDAHYVDAFRTLHPSESGFTFPTRNPQLRLDYVFVRERDRARLRSCQVLDGPGAAQASDHFPLLAELDL